MTTSTDDLKAEQYRKLAMDLMDCEDDYGKRCEASHLISDMADRLAQPAGDCVVVPRDVLHQIDVQLDAIWDTNNRKEEIDGLVKLKNIVRAALSAAPVAAPVEGMGQTRIADGGQCNEQSVPKPSLETKFEFWMDARRFSSERKHLTGGEIKAIANAAPNYCVYRDTGPHFSSHKAVGDGELVDVENAHFYALIPATMFRGNGA